MYGSDVAAPALEALRAYSTAPFGLVSQEHANQVWLRVACKAVRPWYVCDRRVTRMCSSGVLSSHGVTALGDGWCP